MERPIPAFYCCYLLRSTIRKSSLYVGSTPCMPRRLKQHNGVSNGGARRTANRSLRPWEVACLVHGFPSKIAALQFEWAWQKTHKTRHITKEERFTQVRTDVRISPHSSKIRKRPVRSPKESQTNSQPRPALDLTDKIASLHVLLRSKSFERWPLQVRFFSDEAFRVWQTWDRRVPHNIRPGIQVTFIPESQPEAPGDSIEAQTTHVPEAILALNVGYQPMKRYIEKTRSMLPIDPKRSCAVCRTDISQENVQVLICPTENCKAISHVMCLAKHFLHQEQNARSILPTHGRCPGCGTLTTWDSMVKELSLRLLGQDRIENLFKPARSKKPAGGAVDASVAEEPEEGDQETDVDDLDDDWIFQTYETDGEELVIGDSDGESSIKASTPRKWWKGKIQRQPSPILDNPGSSWENPMLI